MQALNDVLNDYFAKKSKLEIPYYMKDCEMYFKIYSNYQNLLTMTVQTTE